VVSPDLHERVMKVNGSSKKLMYLVIGFMFLKV
jgi:hypothetical protein